MRPTPATRTFPTTLARMPRQDGRTIAITGCTSGTGKVLAGAVGGLGARVLLLNRPSSRADAVLAELQAQGVDATAVPCDLQRFASVREAGAALEALCPEGLDVLCNNAGIMAVPDGATEDGFEVQMQTNHLGHFLLTHLALPALERAVERRGEARVVNHSSGAREGVKLDPKFLRTHNGDLGGDGFPGFGKWRRYMQTKLANLLFSYALADQIAAHRPALDGRLKALCAHPGPTDSGLQGKTTAAGGTRLLDRLILWRTLRVAHSTEDGTQGLLLACCDPDAGTRDFFGPPDRTQGHIVEKLPQERNPEAEALLWSESLASTGVARFFA